MQTQNQDTAMSDLSSTASRPSIEETLDFIKAAHAGQIDKGGKPYWQHPASVMKRLGPNSTHTEQTVALLHDVLEDTEITCLDLHKRGYSDEVIAAVVMLTRAPGRTYMDWIRAIAASGNQTAIRVKIADNEDNSNPERVAALPESERDIVRRYDRSLKILRAAVEERSGD